MNCQNCGAALTPIEGRHYLYCHYCSSFLFPDDLEHSQDRITPLGKEQTTECPVCGITMFLGVAEGCQIHYCEKCRGILATCEDFATVVRKRRLKGREGDITPLNLEELQRRIACPVCRRPMEVHPFHGPGAVVIDSCSRCRVVWLDHGEIAAIERAPGLRGEPRRDPVWRDEE